MKKLLLSITFISIALIANAKSLVITLADGTEVYYLLGGEKDPVMTFTNGKVVLNANTYEISNIQKFHISQTDDPTGIKTESFYVKNDQKIEVYSLDGKKMDIDTTHADGISAVNASTLPQGVYIVKVGNQQMKVLKK